MEIYYVLRIRISRRRRRDAAVSSQWTTCSILMVTVVILTSMLDETISLGFARVELFELNVPVVGLSVSMHVGNGTSIKALWTATQHGVLLGFLVQSLGSNS